MFLNKAKRHGRGGGGQAAAILAEFTVLYFAVGA
jgi:hypothetical protein